MISVSYIHVNTLKAQKIHLKRSSQELDILYEGYQIDPRGRYQSHSRRHEKWNIGMVDTLRIGQGTMSFVEE